MAVTATVPILPGAAVNQERSYASYPKSRRRGPSGTVVATRLSTSGLSPRETLLSHAPQARLTYSVLSPKPESNQAWELSAKERWGDKTCWTKPAEPLYSFGYGDCMMTQRGWS